MSKRQSRKSDGAAVHNEDGSLSNARLHEEMTEGVDDSAIRARTRATLRAADVPIEDLNRLFPDLPPLRK